jgi:hypothetical protein
MRMALRVAMCVAALASCTVQANGAVITYTDRTLFESALASQTTIDFEGIVADSSFTNLGPGGVIDGVTFNSTGGGTVGVAGKNSAVAGSPYNSALLFSNNGFPITADLTSAGAGFTAVGGFFGNILGDSPMTLRLFGTSGELDAQTLTAQDMGLGSPEAFFGWTVSGDTLVAVVFDCNFQFEGIDNFTYGVASVNEVPAPASLILWSMGGGLTFVGQKLRRWRKTAGLAA